MEIDKLAWICLQDKKLLVARSKNQLLYYLPGGKRNQNENDQQALIREIKEELSVELVPHTLQYANTFIAQAHGKPEGTLVKMTCYYANYQGDLKADSEIESMAWLSCAEKAQCSLALQIIMDWLQAQGKIV